MVEHVQIADVLRDSHDLIMGRWEKRVLKEISAASGQNSGLLRNDLTKLLTHLEMVLRGGKEDSAELREQATGSRAHGESRSRMSPYSLDQVIREYHIFREVLCEVIEEKHPLDRFSLDTIANCVEQAVNDTASQFMQSLQAHRQALAARLMHDIRAPINTISSAAQLLVQGGLESGKIPELATHVDNAIKRLDHMLQDILDSAKLNAGEHLSLRRTRCDLEKIAKQTISAIDIPERRINLKSRGALVGSWDSDALARILENLLLNAEKYGSKDEPIVVDLRKEDGSARITVHNEGPVIGKEQRKHIFDQFYRGHQENGKHRKGWGIGLATVQGLIQEHGGKVWVESSKANGTDFVCELPLGE